MVVEPRVTPRSKSSSPPRFHPGTQILNRDTMIVSTCNERDAFDVTFPDAVSSSLNTHWTCVAVARLR